MKLRIIALIIGMLFLVGCDDGGPEEVIETPPRTPDTPEKLMEDFEDIYTNMLIDDFRNMLHPDFSLILLTQTIDNWGWAAGRAFDRDEMITIHEHMFAGISGTDHEGNGIHPLDRIDFTLFERVGEWTTVDQSDVNFPGTGRALYALKIYFHDNIGTHAFAVDSQIIFYVTSIDGIYYLRGIRPLYGKAVESTSYDGVLALYR